MYLEDVPLLEFMYLVLNRMAVRAPVGDSMIFNSNNDVHLQCGQRRSERLPN